MPKIDDQKKTGGPHKFQVFERNQAIMIPIGLSSKNLTDPKNEFFQSFMPFYNLFFLSVNVILCGVIIYQYAPVLDLILNPVMIIIAGVQSGGMLLSVGLNMKYVKRLILTVQKIVDNEGNSRNCKP